MSEDDEDDIYPKPGDLLLCPDGDGYTFAIFDCHLTKVTAAVFIGDRVLIVPRLRSYILRKTEFDRSAGILVGSRHASLKSATEAAIKYKL